MLDQNWKLAAALSAACASGVLTAGILWSGYNSRTKRLSTPEKWIRVGQVKDFIVYPVKSCKGVVVNEVTATAVGLQAAKNLRDRVFVVVTSDGIFKTQRQLPKMALIGVEVNGNTLTLSAPGKPDITFNVPEYKPELVRSCKIFDDVVKTALDCGDAVGSWLSEFLEVENLRLYFHVGEKTQRKMVPLQEKFPTFVPNDKGSFQDQTSFMMMTAESLAEVNRNLPGESTATFSNFRPTIVIEGTPEPFAEDFWTYVRIGDADGPIFKQSKPCTRCKLTTVIPEKGEFSEDGEPLKTLYKMKRNYGNDVTNKLVKNQAVLGVQMGLYVPGHSIRKGDSVYAAIL